mgnify:CR=1 FL=1|tara:strand:- start:1827 stop:2402 length:576 start_codon:yes stop_codon:yes gene_type:complete
MKLVSAQNISYSINGKKLFHNISFDLSAGEAIHIQGGNGSGKSALLRIILGITSPSKGSVEYSNQDLEITYLGHKNAIKNYLTPIQNLELLFSDLKLTNAFKWMHKLGLTSVQDELSGNLSFGQQKKLALIRVLSESPKMIVLDEPFVGIDHETSDLLNAFLLDKLSKGVGLIVTSHIQPKIECEVLDLEK